MNSKQSDRITLEQAAEAGQSCACFHLRRAARAVTQRYDEALRPVGLRATQFSILTMVRGRGPIPVQELAHQLVMDRTTLTRNLRPLREAGYVVVEPGSDRRVREVSLTRNGDKILSRAFPYWHQVQSEFSNQLGSRRFQTLLTGLSASVDASATI